MNSDDLEELKKENARLKSELALLKSNLKKESDKFYKLFDRSLAGIFRANLSGSVIDANLTFSRIFGYDSINDLLSDKSCQSHLQLVRDNEGNALDYSSVNEAIENKEVVIKDRQGNIKYGLLSCYVISDNDDFVIEGNLIDITRQKVVEQEVQQYNFILRNTHKMAKIAIFDYCYDSGKVVWSDEFEVVFGKVKPESFTFDWLIECVLEEDRAFVRSSYENSIQNKRRTTQIDYRILSDTGKVKYVQSVFINYFTFGAYSGTSGWIQDITEIKVAQDELVKNLGMMESILNTIPVSVFWKNKSLEYIGSNKNFLIDAGIVYPKDLIGKTDLDMPWKDEAEEVMMDDDKFVLETGESQLNFEGGLKKANGDLAWIKTSKVPLRSPHGDVIGVLGVYEDITEWKKTQNKLLEAYRKIEESDRLKSSFLANISHEIRTPLSAIVGFSDMLGKGDIPQAEVEYFTRLIQNQADNLLKIVSDILDISLIESNQIKLDNKPIDIVQILKDQYLVLTNQLKRLNNDHVRVKLSLPQNKQFYVVGDEVRIRQVLNNLIDNAVKFTQFGFIEVGCKADNNKNVLIFVKDSGIGIAPKYKDVIFERFRQGDESYSKQFTGLGLGLSIARELTDRMAGEIWVESEPEMGSSFYFTLPINLHLEESSQKEAVIDKSKYNVAAWKNKTVLLADDVKHIHQLFVLFAREKGIKVISVMNGAEAVAHIQRNKDVDLVFMDIQMPVMDGIEAMKAVTEVEPHLPIIAFTAYAMMGDKERYLEMGFADYLSKPINADDLWQMFHKYLG